MKNHTLFLILLLSFCFSSSLFSKGNSTQYENPFSLTYGGSSTIIYGDYVSLASSVECVDDGNANCNDNYNGYLFKAKTLYKNDVSIATIPLNSSTETLSLPSDINGSDILYAALYWQGNISGQDAANYVNTFSANSGGIGGRDSVEFIDANANQTTLTADNTWFHDFWGDGTGSAGGHRSFYQAYKNVTTLLQDSYKSGRVNTYTVGNIKATAGDDFFTYFWADNTSEFDGVKIGFWGNWNLIVVYEHSNITTVTPKPKPKNIAIFHGFDALIPLQNNSNKSIDVNISGFLTPKQTPINAKMLFYGSGGEKKLNYDVLAIQDKKTTSFLNLSNAENPADNAFNGSVSSFGVPVDSTIASYPGLDSDEFDVSTYMDTTQSSTRLILSAENRSGTGDQFFPGLVAFSTDVYEPLFCYDYAYKQLGNYFTEDNNGSQNPRIFGSVSRGEPVEVTIYLQNLVNSDVQVLDLNLSVVDLNATGEAKYIRDSTRLAVNTNADNPLADSAIGAVSDASIQNIPIGDLNTNDFFYTYFDINTTSTDLNISLNASASYILHTSTADIPYTLSLSSDIPMCSSSNFVYAAEPGAFNVVHDYYYDLDSGGINKYYNLPTQITKRVGNFKVISVDENSSLKNTSAIVAVETIDAGAFHSALISCQELASSLSKRVWFIFDNNNSLSFNKSSIDPAIGVTTQLSSASDLYKEARENAAFRTSYALDANASLQLIEHVSPTTWKLKNFSLSDPNQTCANSASKISNLCADGMNNSALYTCMECLYGINTNLTCSQDNFSIRPEAFYVQYNDSNQSQSTPQEILNNLSSTSVSTDLAAGYSYNLEINATDFNDTSAASGYTKLYGVFNSLDTAQYTWTTPNASCNDESNTTLSFRISNGDISIDLPDFDQVGKYQLNIVDTSWTTVDNNVLYMEHHDQNYTNGDPMFLRDVNEVPLLDCTIDSTLSNTEISTSLNGCNISSKHSTSTTPIVNYQDINITFHPYKFKVTTTTVGLAAPTSGSTPFIYMADIKKTKNMSVELNTTIQAQGENNTSLTNFVQSCFAKPLGIEVVKSKMLSTALEYQYSFEDYNLTGDIIPSNDINETFAKKADNNISITTTSTFFQKDMNGTINTKLSLNFNRETNATANPEVVRFETYTVSDVNNLFQANLDPNKIATGYDDINNSTQRLEVIHYYGRTNAPRSKFSSDTNQKAFIYYEVFCDGEGNKSLLQDGQASKYSDDPRWFINTAHTSSFGTAESVNQKSYAVGLGFVTEDAVGPHLNSVLISYDGTKGTPYKTTMENNASSWLLYNKYKPNITTNEFEVEFLGSPSSWAGKHDTNTTTYRRGTQKVNRRSMW